jgi:TolA-binding protein
VIPVLYERFNKKWLLAFFLVSFTFSLVSPVSGQIQNTIREIRENVLLKLAKGEYESAIPDLLALIDTLKDVNSTTGRMELESIYYNLGISYFMTGQFSQAEEAFINYRKKYPTGPRASNAAVYIADCLRFSSKSKEAIKAYQEAMNRYEYSVDLKADMYASIARCYLTMDDWNAAREPLQNAFRFAPDGLRRGRAATLLATAFLKTMTLDKLYQVTPYLLQRDSLASHSIAFNLSALEAGDVLFGDERYREALWVFRLVFPYEEVKRRSEAHLERLKKLAEYEKRIKTDPRRLMRIMEWIGDAEGELKILADIKVYDEDLFYRISRGYMEAFRYHEACESFIHLHGKTSDKERAEECLYLAYICSSHFDRRDKFFALARQYMDKYPAGRYYDELTMMTAQVYVQNKNWPVLIPFLEEALRVSPKHQMAAECLFLLGYAYFMEEQFEKSVDRLRDLRKRFPGWEQVDAATYWTGMALMFAGDFQGAEEEFALVMKQSGSKYVEDSSYRRAVCVYALGRYEDADKQLVAFLQRYPEGSLRFEAHMMRGDIAGTMGRGLEGVKYYQEALKAPDDLINIEYYNHAAFQAGQILYDAEKFKEVIDHFESYMTRNREGSNIPLATFWSGKSLFNMGKQLEALQFYKQAVERFGQDRKAMGVDLILDEWIATTKRIGTNEVREAWSQMARNWEQARVSSNHVMRLRYQRILLFKPDITPVAAGKLRQNLLNEENLNYASPSVMEVMLDSALAQNLTLMATLTAERMIADYPETDMALDARMVLAKQALEKAKEPGISMTAAAEWTKKAEQHLIIIRDIYKDGQGGAVEAFLLLGGIYREQKKFDQAQQCFDSVLGVKAWRPSWPEALYGLGLCAEAKKDWLKATAYYERIYVMYNSYRSWTAKAYLRRTECLMQLYQETKAKETLNEFLSQESMKQLPEYEQGVKMRAKLEGKGV